MTRKLRANAATVECATTISTEQTRTWYWAIILLTGNVLFCILFQHTSVVQISLSATTLTAFLQLGIVMVPLIALMDLMRQNTAVSNTVYHNKRRSCKIWEGSFIFVHQCILIFDFDTLFSQDVTTYFHFGLNGKRKIFPVVIFFSISYLVSHDVLILHLQNCCIKANHITQPDLSYIFVNIHSISEDCFVSLIWHSFEFSIKNWHTRNMIAECKFNLFGSG